MEIKTKRVITKSQKMINRVKIRVLTDTKNF